jgi:hypothetical protein
MDNTASDRDSTRRAPDLPGHHLRTDWKAATWAGLIAGLVFLVAEMLLVWLVQGMSPWAPPRMIAAMVLGPGVLPPPADFSLMAVMTALVIHFPLAVVYGLVLGWAVHRLEMGWALLVGAAFGLLAVYAVNFYVIAPMAFPWFGEARNWISVLAHLIFGIVLAGSYVAMRRDTATS